MSGPAPSIQYAWDGPGTLGAGQDGYALVWSQSQGRLIAATAGVTDHGALSGLADDDHPQYALADGSRGSFAATSHNHAGVYLPIAGTAADSDKLDGLDSTAFALSGHSHSAPAHSALSGLTSGDDHTQYVRLAPTTTARNTIQASTQTVYGLTIKAPADSTYDAYYPIFAVQKHDGTNLIRGWSYFNQTYLEMSGSGGTYITGNGNFRISAGGYDVFQLRSPMTSAAVELYCNQATQPVLDVKMFASQSADGFRLKTSSGTVVVSMSPAGALTAASTVQAPSFYQNASGNFLYLTQMRFREAGGSAFALTLGNAAIGFYAAAAVTQQSVSGSRGGNAALADLLTKLATLGLIVDGSSA